MAFIEKLFTGAQSHDIDLNNPAVQSMIADASKYESYMNPEAQGQSRAGQQSFIESLQKQAAGGGPSPTETMLSQQLQQQQEQGAALAASQRGVNPALALRQAQQQQSQAAQAAGKTAAIGRQQEMLSAQGQLGGALQAQRAQDIQNTAQMAQAAQNYKQLGLSVAQANQAAKMQAEGATTNMASNLGGQLIQGIASGASSAMQAAAMSDEDLKTAFKGGGKAVRKFLDHLTAEEYSYKDGAKGMPGAGKKRYVSPMAQDLEKTDLGKSMVINTPNGKMVDYGKGFGAMLAAMADTHQRVKRLEKGGKKDG